MNDSILVEKQVWVYGRTADGGSVLVQFPFATAPEAETWIQDHRQEWQAKGIALYAQAVQYAVGSAPSVSCSNTVAPAA